MLCHLLRIEGLLRILFGACFLSRRLPLGAEGKHKGHQGSHRNRRCPRRQVPHPPRSPLLQRRPLRLGGRQRLCLFQLSLAGRFCCSFCRLLRLATLLQEREGNIVVAVKSCPPGGIWLLGFYPIHRDLKIWIAVETRLTLTPERRRIGQPPINADGLGFVRDPVPQALPDTHQTFVGNVDDGVRIQWGAG